jgi:hypothetical protein
VYGPVRPGGNRWLRLRPADGLDLLILSVMAIGLALYLAGWFVSPPRAPNSALQFLSDALFRSHGSTPVLFFLGALGYLMRWGRTQTRHRGWLVAGVLLTLPLWFLAGLPIGVKGVGDITVIVVPWNVLALVVMLLGVRRSLGSIQESPEETEAKAD